MLRLLVLEFDLYEILCVFFNFRGYFIPVICSF